MRLGFRHTAFQAVCTVLVLCLSLIHIYTANRLLMRTDTEGSPSVAEEKSSAVLLFEAVAALRFSPG